jgi:peptide/nickel transport system permease protein
MTAYVVRRVLALVPVWLAISLIAFILANLAPGDPAEQVLLARGAREPTQEEIETMRERLGLNEPAPVRYVQWVADAATGDLGISYRSGRPVAGELLQRSWVTLQMALPAAALAVVVAIPIGVIAAVWRNSVVDHATRVMALSADSIPGYWLAYLLIILLAVHLGLLPTAGRGTLAHLVMPVVTLAVGSLGSLLRLTRSSLLEVLNEDYIRTARAKGLRTVRVMYPHALKNALIPVVTVAGLLLAHFVTGVMIIEFVFSWPGVGRYVIDALGQRDYPVIQGFVLLAGTVFLLINLGVDLLYVWLDPRVRLGEGS